MPLPPPQKKKCPFSGNGTSQLQGQKTSYISGNGTFQSHIFLIFQERSFRARKIKKRNPPQRNFLTASQKSFSHISGNGTSLYFLRKKLFFYFFEWNFLASSLKNFKRKLSKLKKVKKNNLKKFLTFREMELYSPILKNSCFKRELEKLEK